MIKKKKNLELDMAAKASELMTKRDFWGEEMDRLWGIEVDKKEEKGEIQKKASSN